MALMMINEGATVQVCNSKTKDLEQKRHAVMQIY